MTKTETFFHLHKQPAPLLVGNVWDCKSAELFEKAGYKAIATSSSAIANALGYVDGENMSFEEMLFIVKRIVATTTIPLSVDLERGYGKSINDIIANVEILYQLGVVGINIEDSDENDGEVELVAVEVFSEKLVAIKEYLDKNNMLFFIHARVDSYLLNKPAALPVTMERARAYEKAGADGIFVPFLTDLHSMKEITASLSVPVSVLSTADFPDLDMLQSAGIKRVSMGGAPFKAVYNKLNEMITETKAGNSVAPLFK